MSKPRKLTFEEVLDSMTVFHVDEEFEQRFDKEMEAEASKIIEHDKKRSKQVSVEEVIDFIRTEGLIRAIHLIDISQEKFMRIVSLLRNLRGEFETEWTMDRIQKEVGENDAFAEEMARMLTEGMDDPTLKEHLPLFYRERLVLTSLSSNVPVVNLKIQLKDKYTARYSAGKGAIVEELIEEKLKAIRNTHGIPYARGKTHLVDVTADFALPTLEDPHVIIMSSYNETTSSGQSTKARDMIQLYEKIQHRNVQHGESRAFVNFVDGGGWMQRQKDLRRMVDGCHYVLTIKTLDMLEEIVPCHIPERFQGQTTL